MLTWRTCGCRSLARPCAAAGGASVVKRQFASAVEVASRQRAEAQQVAQQQAPGGAAGAAGEAEAYARLVPALEALQQFVGAGAGEPGAAGPKERLTVGVER